MSVIQIPNLPAAVVLTGAELLEAVQSGTSVRVTASQIAGTAAMTPYTVSNLPPAGVAGRRAYVTDATAPTFLGPLTGGGLVVCPVFDNGTSWVAG